MLKINTKKENKPKEENKKKSVVPRYITFLILSIILGGIFTALTSYAATIAASNISYSNTTSGLTATNAQDAIDEIYENSSKKGRIYKLKNNLGTISYGDQVLNLSNATNFVVYDEDSNYYYLRSLLAKNVTINHNTSSLASLITALQSIDTELGLLGFSFTCKTPTFNSSKKWSTTGFQKTDSATCINNNGNCVAITEGGSIANYLSGDSKSTDYASGANQYRSLSLYTINGINTEIVETLHYGNGYVATSNVTYDNVSTYVVLKYRVSKTSLLSKFQS